MMMAKKRFGVNVMVFVFLLSLYSAVTAVDVPVPNVVYTPVNAQQLETELDNQINVAKGKGHYFYIGVACKQAQQKTTIQTLCSRQGDTKAKEDATKCGDESTHHKDVDVVKDKCGIKLSQVFYSNAFKSKADIHAIEKRLIAIYFNTCKVDPLCLNRKVGQDCSDSDKTGIVYLRVYASGKNRISNHYSDEY